MPNHSDSSQGLLPEKNAQVILEIVQAGSWPLQVMYDVHSTEKLNAIPE